MKSNKYWQGFFIALALGNLYPGRILATSIDGDVMSSSFTFSGPVTMSTVTINTITAASGTVNSFMVVGTTQSNNAPAGRIGEYISTTYSGAGPFGNGGWGDLTSISLPAGDWDVTHMGIFRKNASNLNTCFLGLSTSSGNSTTGMVFGDNELEAITTDTGAVFTSFAIANYRLSLSTTTTVYAKARFDYSTGAPTCDGRISARRVR